MTSISPAILFSRVTFIPWMGIETGDLPSGRGPYWGIRMPYPTAIMMADTETMGQQTEKQLEAEQNKTETEAKKIEPITKIEPKPENKKQ